MSLRHRLPRSPLRRALLASTCVAAFTLGLVVAGCGGGEPDPAGIAPRGAVVYVEGVVRPEGGQRDTVDAIARKVFKEEAPGRRIVQELDKALRDDPQTRTVSWKDDIEPWLGSRAALVVTRIAPRGEAALIVSTTDAGQAEETVNRVTDAAQPRFARRSYKGTDYRVGTTPGADAAAVVDDFLVFGNEPALRAVIDAQAGGALAEKPDFKDAVADEKDGFGFGWIDVKAVVASAGAAGALPPGQGPALESLLGGGTKPVTFSLDASEEQVELETLARGMKADPAAARQSPIIPTLPDDTWLALGSAEAGPQIRRALEALSGGPADQVLNAIRQQLRSQANLDLDRDLLPALGDIAIFARGTSILTIGGGLVVQTPDPAAASRLVDGLRPLISRQGSGLGVSVVDSTVAGGRGFKVTSPQLPGAINVVAGADRMVIAYSDAATQAGLAPATRLSSSADYRAAQESLEGAPPAVFVAFQPISQLVGIAANNPDVQKVRAGLASLRTLAGATQVEGDTQRGRFVLRLR